MTTISPRITRSRLRPLPSVVWIIGMIFMGGCDEAFSPIQPSDLRLSIFGYLDPSADTQWVRVMPIRPAAPTSADAPGAKVTIEHLETGRVIELRDSLFRFPPPNDSVGSEGIFVHNYWTTEPIDTGATYRFSATLERGATSEAIVPIPDDYAVEVWIGQRQSPDLLRLSGVKHVAFVGVITQFVDGCGAGVKRTLLPIPATDSDEHSITLRTGSVFRFGCGPAAQIDHRDLWIVVSGSEWPSGIEHSTDALGIRDVPTNVPNSVGFLGGVLTKLLPYENCQLAGFRPPEYCRLRYDDESATLRGTVKERCSGIAIEDAVVELRELDVQSPAHPRIRSTTSSELGEYEIAALEAGQMYALTVMEDPNGSSPLYREYTDTLEFAPGEARIKDVELAGVGCQS